MKLTRIAPLATFGLLGAALGQADPSGPRTAMLQGTWNVESIRQGCDDVTGAHRGELWIFEMNGRFTRVSFGGAAGGGATQRGHYAVQYRETELDLVLDEGTGGRTIEAYPIVHLDAARMQLLSPTDVKQGVVIKQERFTSFFHS